MKTPIESEYQRRCATTSDINEHLPTLRKLAQGCAHCTEFGTRSGNSTIALLAGLDARADSTSCNTKLVSYDIATAAVQPPDSESAYGAEWEFIQADTGKLHEISETDLLFIDTLHDCAQVEAELQHAPSVRRWLVFHDTVLFGCREESTGQGPGINHAIWNFLASSDGKNWRVWSHYANNCGLLVLRRV